MPIDLVSVTEIAQMLGVSRQRINQLIATYEDFPEPEANLAIGRVWLRSAVEDWDNSHPRRPGRRPVETTTPAALSEGNGPPSGGAGGSRGGPNPRATREKPARGRRHT